MEQIKKFWEKQTIDKKASIFCRGTYTDNVF
jgi:hypothetical protein